MAIDGISQASSDAERESAERFDPATMGGGLIEAEHRARYWWALPWVAGREVLDAGCGVGYGTRLLAGEGPARLVGVDISAEALRDGPSDVAELLQADLRELPFEDDSFDVVVCLEVIEHVSDHARVLDELRRVLRPNGTLLISSPNRDVYAPGNPHHVHEFLPEELRAALEQRFDDVTLNGQHVVLASVIVGDDGLNAGPPEAFEGASVVPLPPGRETYTLAVAGTAGASERPRIAALADPFEVRWWHEQLAQAKQGTQQVAQRVLELEQQLAKLGELEHEATLARAEYHQMEVELIGCRQALVDMKASLSWKLTAPLRAMKRLRR